MVATVVLGGFMATGCGGPVGSGATRSTARSADEPERAASVRRKAEANGWTRGGAWRVIGMDRDPFVVAIALAKGDARMLIPLEPQGYDIRRVKLRCAEGGFTILDGARSARDSMPPVLALKGYPTFDAKPAIRSFCGAKGEITRGGVTTVMRKLRSHVVEGRRSQMDAMTQDGVKGARR